MSHNLSNRKTGQLITMEAGRALEASGNNEDASVFAVGKMWHNLGKVVDTVQTASAAMELAGLNYEVAAGPIYTPDMVEIDKQIGRRIYRTDNATTLGIVGARYEIIQNADGFDLLDTIVGDGDAKYESAGALYNGATVFISAVLTDEVKILDDIIKPRILLKTTHDGSGALKFFIVPERTVCENTLNMNIALAHRSASIKHTRNFEKKVDIAREKLGMTREYIREFVAIGTAMAKVKFTDKQFEALVNELLKQPEDDASKRSQSIYEREREKLFAAWNAADLGNLGDSTWKAYNAVVDYADHGRESRGDNKDANAFIRQFENTALKDRAFDLVTAK